MITPRCAQGWKIMSRFLTVALLAVLVALAVPAGQSDQSAPRTPAQPEQVIARTPADEHLCLGNPSNATPDVNHPENYLMEKPQYCLSYNRDHGEANWVAWHLDAGWMGGVDRTNKFKADKDLPEGWYRVLPRDYARTGYDKGHMCPSEDRTHSLEDNSVTFLMTNMIPQKPRNNQVTWKKLEAYCQRLVRQEHKELYIYAGGTVSRGILAKGRVTVPERTWKVILILEAADGNDMDRINQDTRVIAVDMPNDQSIASDWKQYRVSVDAVEAKTGCDFFSRIPREIQSIIESRVDDQ